MNHNQAACSDTTTKLTRRRKEARNERTVGGRVQRLVVPVLMTFNGSSIL